MSQNIEISTDGKYSSHLASIGILIGLLKEMPPRPHNAAQTMKRAVPVAIELIRLMFASLPIPFH